MDLDGRKGGAVMEDAMFFVGDRVEWADLPNRWVRATVLGTTNDSCYELCVDEGQPVPPMSDDGWPWLSRLSRLRPLPAEPAAEAPMKPEYSVMVRCPCGIHTRWPVGDCDPAQHRCGHALAWERMSDRLVCVACGFAVSGHALAAAGLRHRDRYDYKGNALADETQRVRDENAELLRENATLRRASERLERRGKR